MANLSNAVNRHKKMIFEAERRIWSTPETGYREFLTTEYLANRFEEIGYKPKYADGITGFYADFDTGRPGPCILVLAELDSIICAEHPEADKSTGAVHSCGHNAQCAALLGVAAALAEDGVCDKMCGKIRLCAVPAEELIELDFRNKLKSEGKIRHFCGKREFLSRGYFDGADAAMMVHISQSRFFSANYGAVGCIAKRAVYKGKSAHAGGNPWDGINALYAANCGINAANALRETFGEDDIIRFHPIITNGGKAVSAIPETVSLESYVRGRTFDAMTSANAKINRALVGGALSLGAEIEISDVSGYSPLVCDPLFTETAKKALNDALGKELMFSPSVTSGSTDMGDLSCIMPVIHPYAPGAVGTSHGSDYYIADPATACADNAKWQTKILELLLENGAESAKRIIGQYKPAFPSAEAFLEYIVSFEEAHGRIIYRGDGSAEILK